MSLLQTNNQHTVTMWSEDGRKMRFVRDNVVTRPKNEDSSLAVFLELEYYLVLLDSLFRTREYHFLVLESITSYQTSPDFLDIFV